MVFDSGGGASVSTFGGGGSSSTVLTTAQVKSANGYTIPEPVYSNGPPQYAYVDNSGNVAYSSVPVTFVGQGLDTSTGQVNPGLIVDSNGTILSGPGTGGTYNPTTNVTVPPSSSSSPTGPSQTGVTVPAIAGFTPSDLLLGALPLVALLLLAWWLM